MFTEEDLKRASQFGKFLSKAKLDISVSEWLEFNKLLVWYNGMIAKVGDHIYEPKEIIQPPDKKKKAK